MIQVPDKPKKIVLNTSCLLHEDLFIKACSGCRVTAGAGWTKQASKQQKTCSGNPWNWKDSEAEEIFRGTITRVLSPQAAFSSGYCWGNSLELIQFNLKKNTLFFYRHFHLGCWMSSEVTGEGVSSMCHCDFVIFSSDYKSECQPCRLTSNMTLVELYVFLKQTVAFENDISIGM